jgi:DNA primase
MPDNQLLILDLLERILGTSKKTSKGNYAFKCPNNCHPIKHKLEINLESQQYQCWICGGQSDGFRGKSLKKLFQHLKLNSEYFQELNSLINTKSTDFNDTYISNILELPKEFKSIINNSDFKAIKAKKYLKKRGLSIQDILKYNIGYCKEGTYSNMIIIPSYDSNHKLNYFIARSFNEDSYIKYKNPDVSRDIIMFELFINWDLPIILCEGPFDAIAIKRNVIPLLGKTLQPNLMKKIISSKVKKIYIALDKDAMKQALQYTQYFLDQGKEVYLVELEDKDPSQMGFKKFTQLIQNTPKLNIYDLMEKKLNF